MNSVKSNVKSVVLLSAGLDSTVNLYMALKDTQVVQTLTFNYGQRAAKKEIERAAEISKLVNVPHMVIDLPWLKNFGQSSLTDHSRNVPTGQQVKIDSLETSQTTARAVWVPNRNGIFLNIAAGLAESLGAHMVIPGFNQEEAATFPDNSFEFVRSLRKCFTLSTANHVEVHCFTIAMMKPEIVAKGKSLNVPFQKIWPCYYEGEKWCGQCESCLRSKRAFLSQNIDTTGLFAS